VYLKHYIEKVEPNLETAMDAAVSRSLDEITILAPVFVMAIAAIVVGLALVVEGFSDHRLRTAKRWRNSLGRFVAFCRLNLMRATEPVVNLRRSNVSAVDHELRTIKSHWRRYTLGQRLGRGDLADVYSAAADGQEFVLKIARPRAGGPLLLAEGRRLAMLAANGGGRSYGEYFPRLVESFSVRIGRERRQVNSLEHRAGFFTLEDVRRRYPNGLDGRHLAWVFKRVLAGLGFVHSCGLVHGAVLPPHVMVHAENHGMQFLDWIHAAPIGGALRIVPSAFRDWYPREVLDREPTEPATDIYLAAKCLIYLAGGDPIVQSWPAAVPQPMRRFVNTCLYPAARMRPQDAWTLHEEFDELLLRLFGPSKYHRLVMA
jgi:hypothetical protein